MAIEEKIKKKKREQLLNGVFPKGGITEQHADLILDHLDRKENITQKTNLELAELLIDSKPYGSTVIMSDDMLILDEIMRRLLNGTIPESWEIEEK